MYLLRLFYQPRWGGLEGKGQEGGGRGEGGRKRDIKAEPLPRGRD